MSNIEPLLNAVDTLVELIREYDDAQSRTEEEALIESINNQADYISGIIVGIRSMKDGSC
jgi:F0F1-type ATP synthase assembly protein I